MPYRVMLQRNDGTFRPHAVRFTYAAAMEAAEETGYRYEVYLDEQLIAFSTKGKLCRKPRKRRRRR